MAIPSFTIDGVLPPFLGSDPSGDPAVMSPYAANTTEVVDRFATTDERRAILKGWLDHRIALPTLGITRGFQWLDGSFLEEKEPNDLDLVTFVARPPSATGALGWGPIAANNPTVFDRSRVKSQFRLDIFFLDLDGNREALISATRYFLQLFSHQRQSFLWKGMLQVPLDSVDDDAFALGRLAIAAGDPAGGQP